MRFFIILFTSVVCPIDIPKDQMWFWLGAIVVIILQDIKELVRK